MLYLKSSLLLDDYFLKGNCLFYKPNFHGSDGGKQKKTVFFGEDRTWDT